MSEQVTEKVKKKQNRVKSPEGTIETKMIPTELPNGLKTETKVFVATYPGYKGLLEPSETEVLTKPEADEWIAEQRKWWRAARRFDLARQGVGATVKSLFDRMGKIPTNLLSRGETDCIFDARGSLEGLGKLLADSQQTRAVFVAWTPESDEPDDENPGD